MTEVGLPYWKQFLEVYSNDGSGITLVETVLGGI